MSAMAARLSSQHKPVLVCTPSFGTGVVSERRSDGINVVQLPWGKVYLDQKNLGTIISSQYKRTRYDEDDDDNNNNEHMAIRRKAEEQQRQSQHQQPQHQQPQYPAFSPYPTYQGSDTTMMS